VSHTNKFFKLIADNTAR